MAGDAGHHSQAGAVSTRSLGARLMRVVPSSAGCAFCGRRTYDPSKKERPWARGVSSGAHVLVCPECQSGGPAWIERMDRCSRCGSTRLSLTLGEVVCRECGVLRPTE